MSAAPLPMTAANGTSGCRASPTRRRRSGTRIRARRRVTSRGQPECSRGLWRHDGSDGRHRGDGAVLLAQGRPAVGLAGVGPYGHCSLRLCRDLEGGIDAQIGRDGRSESPTPSRGERTEYLGQRALRRHPERSQFAHSSLTSAWYFSENGETWSISTKAAPVPMDGVPRGGRRQCARPGRLLEPDGLTHHHNDASIIATEQPPSHSHLTTAWAHPYPVPIAVRPNPI